MRPTAPGLPAIGRTNRLVIAARGGTAAGFLAVGGACEQRDGSWRIRASPLTRSVVNAVPLLMWRPAGDKERVPLPASCATPHVAKISLSSDVRICWRSWRDLSGSTCWTSRRDAARLRARGAAIAASCRSRWLGNSWPVHRVPRPHRAERMSPLRAAVVPLGLTIVPTRRSLVSGWSRRVIGGIT
jgi:hypothetical protein